MKIKVRNVRVAFVAFHAAESFQGDGKPKFGCRGIIDPKSENVAICRNALKAVARDRWESDKGNTILAELMKKDRVFYREHTYCNANGDPHVGFEGMYYVGASADVRPRIVGQDGTTPLVAADGKPYSGSYCDLVLEIWAQDNKFGKRVNATLKGVQFRADGDAFTGGTPLSDADFDDLSTATALGDMGDDADDDDLFRK